MMFSNYMEDYGKPRLQGQTLDMFIYFNEG